MTERPLQTHPRIARLLASDAVMAHTRAMVTRCMLVAVLAMGSAAPLRAGECPQAQLRIVPFDGGLAVPTNVKIRLLFAAEQVEVFELIDPKTRQIRASGYANASSVNVILRDSRGTVVATSLRRTTAAPHPVVFVEPTSALAARESYELVVHTDDRDYIVSHFTTGDDADTTPPELAKVLRAQLYTWLPEKRPDWKSVDGAFAEVTVAGVTDAIGFEIHELAPNEKPSATTLRVVTGLRDGKVVRFGSTDSCISPDYRIPAPPKRKQPRKLHLSIRAFDLAGNVSTLRDVTIDLARRKTAK